VLAIWKGARVHADVLINFTSEEVLAVRDKLFEL
jgi:hypothetical protein